MDYNNLSYIKGNFFYKYILMNQEDKSNLFNFAINITDVEEKNRQKRKVIYNNQIINNLITFKNIGGMPNNS